MRSVKQCVLRLRQTQEGAVAVTVAVSMLAFMGIGMIAIDAGSLWMTKRNIVADTDAAALAGALRAAESACDVTEATTEATTYLSHNRGTAVDASAVAVGVDCARQIVTVDFTAQAPMTFAGAFGWSQLDVISSSTAVFDYVGQGSLRPLATCIGNETLFNPDGTLKDTSSKIVVFDKGWANPCNSVSGNWGWLCFDTKDCQTPSGAEETDGDYECTNPTSALGYMRCGYGPPSHPQVWLGTSLAGDEDCSWATPNPDTETVSPEPVAVMDWCWTKPGINVGEMATDPMEKFGKAYDKAIDVALAERFFPIIIFDQWLEDGNGRTVLHPVKFLWIEFEGYCLNADNYTAPWGVSRDRHECSGSTYIMQLRPVALQDSTALPPELSGIMRPQVSLCGVDHDPDGGDRC